MGGGGPAPTLNQFDQGDTRATVLAIAENQRNEISMTETMGTLGQGGGKPGQGNATVLAFGHTQGIDIQPSEHATPTLRTEGGGADGCATAAVRRLTPLECERLQGWPDAHTALGVDADGNTISISDSARYRMIGNGVASPVAAWIGRHMAAVEADL